MAYRQIAPLGSGYFGEVWLEEDLGLGRECVAKYLKPDRLPIGVDLHAEAQAMIAAQHQNVATVYSADIHEGRPVIRMEYLPQGSVEGRHQGSPVPVGEAVRILEDACRGVQHLHTRGLLHRDIKPANLLLGDNGAVKVSDFGLACRQDAVSAAPPMAYISHLPPECAITTRGIETITGDIYALGVTAYRLLNGDDAFRSSHASTTEMRTAIAAGDYPNRKAWLPHIHPKLRRVITKTLHMGPESRHQSAADLRHSLEGVRPAISWSSVKTESEWEWSGLDAKNQTEWRARITTVQGKRIFSVERCKARGKWRTLTADGFSAVDESEAVKQASHILGRIAQNGK